MSVSEMLPNKISYTLVYYGTTFFTISFEYWALCKVFHNNTERILKSIPLNDTTKTRSLFPNIDSRAKSDEDDSNFLTTFTD